MPGKPDPFTQVSFITSAHRLDQCPSMTGANGESLPEVALIGRSNVGKSSLLNMLCRRRQLAKISNTPGKTQLINFFRVGDRLTLVDLPGYGYAQVSAHTHQHWGKTLERFLQERTQLKAVLFLFDIRRSPNPTDHAFIDWLQQRQLCVILAITKVDKVATTKRKGAVKRLLESFGRDDLPVVLTSATKKLGRKELLQAVNLAIDHGTP